MDNLNNLNKKKYSPSGKTLVIGALLSALVGFLAFLPITLHHNGQYVEYGDYFIQYVPFIKELKRMIASGDLSWSWNSFLGDSFVEAYSYYTVFNPFAYIAALFPMKYLLWVTLGITLLKFSLATVSATLFIRRFTNKDAYALIGAFLYTFSGFTFVNTYFYFFVDIIALFPFILWGVEKIIDKESFIPYIVAIFVNLSMNFYMFICSALITLIYVFFRLELWRIRNFKTNFRPLLTISLCTLAGFGLSSFALFPSLKAILRSPKAASSIGVKIKLLFWAQKFLDHIRTLISPVESNMHHLFYNGSLWSSTGVYLPIFGSFAALYYAVKKRDFISLTCIFLTVCYFVPALNSAFSLYTSTYYTRWLHGMALMFSLATAVSLESAEEKGVPPFSKKMLSGYTIFTSVILIFPTVIDILYYFGINLTSPVANACTTKFFMGYPALFTILALTALNFVGLWYIVKAKNLSHSTLTVMVLFACFLNFAVYNALNYDRHEADSAYYSNAQYYEKTLSTDEEEAEYRFEYRIDHPSEIRNYGLFKNKASVNYFNSLQNPSSAYFAERVGIGEVIWDTILLTPAEGTEYSNALLSVKYFYDYDTNCAPDSEYYTYIGNENGVDIWENNNYIPMGMTYDTYILESLVDELDTTERAHALLSSLAITPEDEETVSKYLNKATSLGTEKSLEELSEERRRCTCDTFVGTSSGFTAEITLESDNIVFFSVPYDEGFEVTVNSEKAEVIQVNYSLMGVICPSGKCTISAVYHTSSVKYGFIPSIVTLVILVSVCTVKTYKRKKQNDCPAQ